MREFAITLLALAACGGDDEGGGSPAKPGAANPAAAAAAAAAAKPVGLVTFDHVEDRVTCATARKVEDLPPAEDKCDPGTPNPCKDKTKPYCLTVQIPNMQAVNYCYACTERDNIRHPFKDRDFVAEQNRDPFQSFVLSPSGVGSGSNDKPVEINTAVKCNDYNTFMTSFSYSDLKLVGIVTQGTLRKGLVAAGRSSAIIKRNDCVGKEKAIVKEVGDGFATFVTQPDPNVPGSRAVEFTALLRQTQLNLSAEGSLDAPSVNPGTNVPTPGTSVPTPGKSSEVPPVRVEIPQPKQQTVPQPVQPPAPATNLNP